MIKQFQTVVETRGKALIDITPHLTPFLAECQVMTGLCHVFLHHTSASLIINENADNAVKADLETFMQRIVPEDAHYQHQAEGPDDMPAHIRSVLTANQLMIPIIDKKLGLGRWQGVFLWEHRSRPHQREVTVTLIGA